MGKINNGFITKCKDLGFINSLKSDLHKLEEMGKLLENTENIYGQAYSDINIAINEVVEEITQRIKNMDEE